MRPSCIENVALKLSFVLLAAASAPAVLAAPLSIRPIDFGSGMVASGTIVTDDATGGIVDWSLAVRTTTRLAHYTKSNTRALVVDQTSVSVDGKQLRVATSPDPATMDGGQLFFRSPNPFQDFGALLADFTGPSALGGQAMYMAGGVFDFLSLGAPDASQYTVATRTALASSTFALQPLAFTGGVTLSGTLATDGTIGALTAANIVDWDIVVDQITEDLFDKSNSVMSAVLASFDPTIGEVVVTNPDGRLSFNKTPLGNRPHSLVLADFTDEFWPSGKAAYYQGRLSINETPLGASRGAWRVTGSDPINVPEPATIGLLTMLGIVGVTVRMRRR